MILTTERLILDELKPGDAQLLYSIRSDEKINRYLNREPAKSMEDVKAFIEKIRKAVSEGVSYYWVIRLKGDSSLIGTVCLWNLSPENSRAEIGYEMLPMFQGKGYTTEAVKKVVDFSFKDLGLKKIEAYTHRENLPSTRVLEKQGFRQTDKVEPGLPDTIVFCIEP